MAKKETDGEGLDIPNRIKALPVKRTGPVVAASSWRCWPRCSSRG